MMGYIYLHRMLLNSESSFQTLTPLQQLIAIYILLNANYKDGIWRDKYRNQEVKVKRGQLITSRNTIKSWFGEKSGITDQVIRTAIKKLENINFLTKEVTKSYTLLNIVNYGVYQNQNFDANQQVNQVLTTNNNNNKINNNNINSQNEEKSLKDKSTSKAILLKDLWNKHCSNRPAIKVLSLKKIAKINARLKKNSDIKYWKMVINKINQLPLDQTKWLNFDWLIKNDENNVKVIEGVYDWLIEKANKNGTGTNSSNMFFTEEELQILEANNYSRERVLESPEHYKTLAENFIERIKNDQQCA